MDKKFFEIQYGRLCEAVTALKDGKVAFFNGAAAELFPEMAEGDAGENYFPDGLCLAGEDGASDSVAAKGMRFDAFSVRTGDFVIVTVAAGELQEKYNRSIMDVSAVLKDAVSVFRMSGEGLSHWFERAADPKVQQYAAVMQHTVHSLSRMASHISDVYSGAEIRLAVTRFDLAELGFNVVETVNYLSCRDRKKVEFVCERDRLPFNGDSYRIEQIMLNLLSNSLKYTPADGTVTLKVAAAPHGAVITVADTGCGMDERAARTAFSRFREERDTHDVKSGLGLGLPLVQEIAALHGGACVITAGKDGGTVAAVTLKSFPDKDVLRDADTDYTSGLSLFLTELSDVTRADMYVPRNMD